MDAIEKRARELLAAQYRKAGISDDFVSHCITGDAILTWQERMAVDAIRAALLLGRPVHLLDQDGASRIEAQELQVVPSAAFGADEAGAVGVDQVSGGVPRDIQLAEVASEHEACVRPKDDSRTTVLEVLDSAYTLLSSRVWDPLLAVDMDDAEEFRKARAKIAEAFSALTPPEGFVPVPVALVTAIEDLSLIYEAGGDIDSKLSQVEGLIATRPDHIAHDLKMVAGRPEVKP
ncbi:hypothetical protein [Stenotrophomonas sp. Sm0581]|uniref:hypothetical protein n=1 Tax=Stenotrophomonas sp. Sm0581 TaxID=3002749 RepID=UPI0027E4F449|nr:hypothetical protein [Stenotrophomonas sp. Sm0581]MDQ7301909.1 hypothetical protein [Stenotrophomonas sp. Sm0581]